MARRTDTILGLAAAAVALSLIAVFGYRTLRDDDGDDGDDRADRAAADDDRANGGVVGPEVPRRDRVVDRDYLFTLTAPGPEWEVFDRAESDGLWFAQIAAMEGDRATLQVAIDRIGDLPLDVAATVVEGWLGGTPSRKSVRWLDRDAIELDVPADVDGRARRARIFIRDGLLHHISLIRGPSTAAWIDSELETLWGAFALLDGTPHATTPAFPVRDRVGVGWRVDGTTWESAIAGIRATPPDGWRLMTGRALGDGAADVELVNEACGCYATITSFVGTAPAPGPKVRTMVVDTLGTTVSMVAQPVGPTDGYQVWDGNLALASGLRIGLQFWYPKAEPENGITELRRALHAFTVMPEPEREALARALERPRFDPTAVGPSWALRNGIYADYARGLVWRRPAGFWRVLQGEGAAALLDDAVMAAVEPESRVMVIVVPDDTAAAPDRSARWVTENINAVATPVLADPATPRLGAGHEGLFVAEDDGLEYVHRVFPLVGTRSFRVHVVGTTAQIRAHAGDVTAALAGLEVRAELAPTVRLLRAFEDHRFGYQIDLPPDWMMTDRGDGGTNVDRTWVHGDAEMIGVVAEVWTGSPDNRVVQMRGRLTSSAAVGTGTAPRPHESTARLAGEDAVKLSWREGPTMVVVFFVEHDGVLYTVYTRGTTDTVELARRVFKFVPRPD